MKRKLERRKLDVKTDAEVRHLARNIGWRIDVESGAPIAADYIANIHEGELIFEQLLIYLRSQRSKRAVANHILRYLKYVASANAKVDASSLLDFKRTLDSESSMHVNSKANLYSACRKFVTLLMEAQVIPTEHCAKSFQMICVKPKQSIMELASDEVMEFGRDRVDEVKRLAAQHNLKYVEASTLAFGEFIIERYHTLALDWIEGWFRDCELVDNIIENIDLSEIDELKKVSDYRGTVGDWRKCGYSDRSIELALKLLYSRFGRLIPSSTDWPLGIADFCKVRGWPPRKIQSAFFTSAYNLQYFLVATLSHTQLAPNVDSVVYYSYLDAFMPATERGKISVHLGKKRGNPLHTNLPRADRLCKVFSAYQDRLKRLFQEVPGGDSWLKKEQCELFVHYTKTKGRYSIRTFDKSLTSYMVKRTTKELAHSYPEFRPLVGKITGENFRPSIAAIAMLSGSSLSEVKERLKHRHQATTESYAIRVETHSVLDHKLKAFQQYLLENRHNNLPNTGTGYLCAQKENNKKTCAGVDMCFACDAKRVILKDKKLIAEWVAHVEYIRAHEQRLKFNNPQRWDNYWQYKLSEYEALLSKCTRIEIRKAKALASEIVLPLMD